MITIRHTVVLVRYLILFLILVSAGNSYGQNMAINSTGAAPDGSAMLDVSSTTSGFLAPRMTLTDRGNISSPAIGLLIYQTDNTPGFYLFNGTAWVTVGDGHQWSITGNSGTSASTNFLGTTDNVDLVIRTNNTERARFDNAGGLSLGTTATGQVLLMRGLSGTADFGIASNKVGGGSSMELTTADASGVQATRLILRGSTNTQDIEFYTGASGSEAVAMFLEGSNGNFGIGNSTPQNRLDVEGAVAIGSSYSGSTSAPADGLIVEGNVGIGQNSASTALDVNGMTTTDSLTVEGGSGNPGYVLTDNGSGVALWTDPTSLSDGDWTVSGTTMYNNTTDMAAGLGTSSPNSFYKLELETASSTQGGGLYIENDYTGSSPKYGLFNELAANGTGTKFGIFMPVQGTAGESDLIFGNYTTMSATDGTSYGSYIQSSTSGSGSTYGIYTTGEIDNYLSGATGIGTNDPKSKLDVEGSLAVGSSYSGSTAAPTDGLIVEGQVGFGTSNPFTLAAVELENSTYSWASLIDQNYSGTAAVFGQYIDVSASGTGTKLGLYLDIDATSGATNATYGTYAYMSGSGNTAEVIGSYVQFQSNSSGTDFGFYAQGDEQNYFTGNLSLGSTTFANKLDVEGAAAIGSSYSGNSSAPTNGLIVEGQTGLGTNNPSSLAQVEIESSSLSRGLSVDQNYSGSSSNYGIYVDIASSGTGAKFGSQYEVRATSSSSSNLYGSYNRMYGSGTSGAVIGFLTEINTNSSGVDYGFYAIGEEDNYFSGGLSLNTLSSTNILDVEGNVAIGSSYSGNVAAPSNGLIVQGNTGIGTDSPDGLLDVAGSARIGTTQSIGSQSTDQSSGNANNQGFLSTPWVYTNAIEAEGERGASSTLITVGNDGTYGTDDEIHMVVSGNDEFTIKSDGDIGAGTDTPTRDFHVNHASGGSDDGLAVSNASGGTDTWHFYTWLGNDLGLWFNGTIRGNFDDSDGSYSTSSDARLKKNIATRSGLLDEVMQLRVTEYHFLEQSEERPKEIGFIAQEVLPLFPHLVTQPNAEGGEEGTAYYSLDYAGMSAVAIGAIQEQQKKIETLEQRIQQLEEQLKQLQEANK